MSRRSYTRAERRHAENSDDDRDHKQWNRKRAERSRSPIVSYGFSSDKMKKTKRSSAAAPLRDHPASSSSSSSSSKMKSNGFVPDEETKKFYDKSADPEVGFWTTDDYTFRDMLAKDVRDEIEDDIASRDSDEQSDEDSELADYAERADLDDQNDEQQKKTIVERMVTKISQDEKKPTTETK